MDKVNKYKNKLKFQSGGRMREFGIKNYINNLSNPDSKLNLDTLDEVFTSLENICNTTKISNDYYNNHIECSGDNSTNKYLDLYKDLILMQSLNGNHHLVIKMNNINVLTLMK